MSAQPRKSKVTRPPLEANPPRGARRKEDGFRLQGIRMPGWMVAALKTEALRRQMNDLRDSDVSSIVREAVAFLLEAAPPWDPSTFAKEGRPHPDPSPDKNRREGNR